MTKIRQEDAPHGDLVDRKPHEVKDGAELARKPHHHGEHEIGAAKNRHQWLTPLSVSDRVARTVPGAEEFSEQFSIYKVPFHQTMTSLGRVNDLRTAGAPRTPAEIPASVMKRIKPIDNVSNKESERSKSSAANQWIEQQGELHATFDSFMQARKEIASATSQFQSTQQIVLQRQLTAKLTGKKEERDKIDAAASTLAKITTISAEALTFMKDLENELMGVEESYASKVDIDLESGNPIQTADVRRRYRTDKLQQLAKMAGGAFSLKEIFIWGMNDWTRYQELQDAIAKLQGELAEAKLAEENLKIQGAWQKLDNVRLAVTGTRRAFTAKRGDARNAAQHFGQTLGGREKTIMIALIAEAYHELELFGSRSRAEADQLAPKAEEVRGWLNENSYRYNRPELFDQFSSDFRTLGRAVIETDNSTELLKQEVPSWQQTATAWRHFLSDVMGKSFDQTEADVEAER